MQLRLSHNIQNRKIYEKNPKAYHLFLDSKAIYTVSQKNPCDYVFDNNLNSKRPIVIIFGTVIT